MKKRNRQLFKLVLGFGLIVLKRGLCRYLFSNVQWCIEGSVQKQIG